MSQSSPAPRTISQALRRVKEIKGRLAILSSRLHQSVCWMSDKEPVFSFTETLEERGLLVNELIQLKASLAKTNTVTAIEFREEKMSVQAAIFLLAELKAEVELYRGLHIREDEEKEMVGTNRETGLPVYEKVQYHSALGERARIELVESLQTQVSELNGLLEAVNHQTKLVW